MIENKCLGALLETCSDLLALIGHESPEDSSQSLVSAYNRVKSRLSSSEVASKLNLSDAELPLFEASLRDFAKRVDAIDGDDPERTTVISALRLISWLETLQSRGVAITAPDFAGLPVDEDVGRKQVRALELILRSLVSERFGGDLEQQLKTIIKSELVDKWKASGDPDDLLSGTTFSELASLFVNKDEFSHYEKLYSHSAYLNYLRDRRKTVQNFLDDVRRVRNVLAHNKSISDAQLQLLEMYYEELTSPIQDAFDNGETSVDPSAYLDVSREELQSYFVDLKEDIASVQDELADFRASVEGDLGVIKDDTAVIRETTAGVKSRTTMIASGVAALLVLVGGAYFFLVGTQENTEAILVDTATIKQTTTETNQAITEVQQSSRRIEGSLDSIQQGFETLSQSGGVIQNPERPEQFYHNARVYEDRGDYLNARKSYNEFFKFQLEVLDPYLRYSTFLKVQEGRKGALEVFGSLIDKFPTKSAELAKILLEENPDRTRLLRSFVERNQEYVPAYYYLAEQYSERSVGEQTLEDKGFEREALSLVIPESLPKFYIDKALVSEIAQDASSRLKASANLKTLIIENPVSLTGNLFDQDWMLNIQIAEAARSISYAFDSEGPYVDNGHLDYIDQRIGDKMPNPMITLPNDATKQSIFVKYKNINEKLMGPYEVVFDPEPLLVNGIKQTLKLVEWANLEMLGPMKLPSDKALTAEKLGYEPTNKTDLFRLLESEIQAKNAHVIGALFDSIRDPDPATYAENVSALEKRLGLSLVEVINLNRYSWTPGMPGDPIKLLSKLVELDPEGNAHLTAFMEDKTKASYQQEAKYTVKVINFRSLFNYKCGVVEIRYGINQKALDQLFSLSDCDPINPHRSSHNFHQTYVIVPETINEISVQLLFQDGELSEIKTYGLR